MRGMGCCWRFDRATFVLGGFRLFVAGGFGEKAAHLEWFDAPLQIAVFNEKNMITVENRNVKKMAYNLECTRMGF